MTLPSSRRPLSPTPLRPATYAGVTAALLTIGAQVVIRVAPSLASTIAAAHFIAAFVLFVMAGALATRLGGDGWRAGLFAGLLDALVGHAIAFFIAVPPDPATVTLPRGVEATSQVLGAMQLWGAVLSAIVTIAFAIGGGALGGWYARRTLGTAR